MREASLSRSPRVYSTKMGSCFWDSPGGDSGVGSTYSRRVAPEIVTEMGAVVLRGGGPFLLLISGGGFLVKLKVGPFPPTFAAPQINRLLALSLRRDGLKYHAAMAGRTWWRWLDLTGR